MGGVDLIIRIKTFPLELIESINLIDLKFLDSLVQKFHEVLEKL